MGVLMWLAIGLMIIGAVTIACTVLLVVLICLTRPQRAPVSAGRVLEKMSEQRAAEDFAAWLTELDDR